MACWNSCENSPGYTRYVTIPVAASLLVQKILSQKMAGGNAGQFTDNSDVAVHFIATLTYSRNSYNIISCMYKKGLKNLIYNRSGEARVVRQTPSLFVDSLINLVILCC